MMLYKKIAVNKIADGKSTLDFSDQFFLVARPISQWLLIFNSDLSINNFKAQVLSIQFGMHRACKGTLTCAF